VGFSHTDSIFTEKLWSKIMNKLIWVFAFIGSFGLLMAATGAAQSGGLPSDHQRVWVQYHSGKKDLVRQALLRAGARLHYDFAELDSFVVSMPASMIHAFKRNPDVKDVWYAQLTSRQETK